MAAPPASAAAPTTEQLLQMQNEALRQQDRELDGLSGVISQVRGTAGVIGETAELQTRLLEDVGEDVEAGSRSLQREAERLDLVKARADTKSLWGIIAALSFALLVMIILKL